MLVALPASNTVTCFIPALSVEPISLFTLVGVSILMSFLQGFTLTLPFCQSASLHLFLLCIDLKGKVNAMVLILPLFHMLALSCYP